ncbi:MAG: hypothetical protein KJZ85_12380 [Rhodobacteraceae bacterium]|jgi:hypothetical protein|nr:hypothetical protein [Paracoccaceae bacterium]
MRARLPLILALCLGLGGCGGRLPAPDALELANLRPWNAVPATAPARLVAVFEQVCIDGPEAPDRAAAALHAMDYVESPGRPGAAVRGFLVDDDRPAVLVGSDGRSCAVAARARTGQTAGIAAMVARRFPDARGLAPVLLGPRTERGWATPGGGFVLLHRVIVAGRPSELLLIRLRG